MGNIEPQHSTTCTIVILLVCLCTHTIKGVGEFRCHAQPVPTPYFGLARISCVYNQTSSHKQKRQSSTLSIHLSYLSSEGREFARIEVGLAVFHWEWPRLFLNAWSIKGLVRSGNKYFVAQKCSMAPAYILIRPHLWDSEIFPYIYLGLTWGNRTRASIAAGATWVTHAK